MANEVRLIDANALRDAFTRSALNIKNEKDIRVKAAVVCCRNVLDQAPTIDPESLRPKGRWVNERVLVGGFNVIWGLDCSECGKTVKDHKSNFCPNCGADMRK